MTIVTAYQIEGTTEWMSQTLGGNEDYTSAVVTSKNGDKKHAQFPSEFNWKVGDWVVLWPNGFKNIQTIESFSKHFKHIDGIRYETDLQALF